MPNDFIPNHMITDHMGLRIKNAVDDVTRALGGTPTNPVQSNGNGGGASLPTDFPFVFAHLVDTYPGEGEDPYDGQYTNLEHNRWIDLTAKQIKDILESGKIIIVIDPSRGLIMNDGSISYTDDVDGIVAGFDAFNKLYVINRLYFFENSSDEEMITMNGIGTETYTSYLHIYGINDYPGEGTLESGGGGK